MTRSSDQAGESPLRLAYLNTRYPALSHTFIQREVEALRKEGAEVIPFSIRRPTLAELGEGADGEERARTVYLLDGAASLLGGVVGALFTAPRALLRVLAASQRLSPAGLGHRLRHFAYAIESLRLAREMRRRDLRTVHVHMANNGAMVALLATRFDRGLAYSLTIHGSAEFFDVYRLRLQEKVDNALFVRCISEFCRSQVMTWSHPRTWRGLHVVHCGVDPEAFLVRRTPPADRLRLITVGRFVPIKGYPVLFEALEALVARGVPWSLRMVGDGPGYNALRGLADTPTLRGRVKLLGPLAPAGVRGELAQADVLVVSSFMEGIPVVLMEAMAAGVPVVSTAVGGVSELVEDSRTGTIVAPGRSEPIACALEELWADPSSGVESAERARQHVREQFEIRGVARQMRALFARYHPE